MKQVVIPHILWPKGVIRLKRLGYNKPSFRSLRRHYEMISRPFLRG